MKSSIILALSVLVTLAATISGIQALSQPFPVDCRLVRCAAPLCPNPIPANPAKGKCCPTCPPIIDCRLVLCAKPQCPNPIPANPAKGKCCPTCPDVCKFNGKTFQVDDTFPAGDGCNTCTCSAGGLVACTKIACQVCEFNGKFFQVGDSFPAGDGCNTCTCTAPNNVACTEIACVTTPLPTSPTAPPTLVCPPLPKDSFGICVNLCSGDDDCPDGQKCCSNGCGTVCKIPVPVGVCKFNGKVLRVGESFPAGDGCNRCSCIAPDRVVCTLIACSPPTPPQPTCPPDKPPVNCFVDPCRFAKCPAHPRATCISDFCGGCNARFFENGKEVTDTCECPVQGQVFTECGSACPPNCTDPTPICTTQCVPRCQCPQGTVINEVTNKCVPVDRCPKMTPIPPTCPPDKPRVYCFVSPCQFAKCPAHPDAKCVDDYCGGCNARFFDSDGNEVTDSCKCPVKGQVFTECGSACPPNCTDPTPICTRQCVPRCQCPQGTVINEVTNKCVPVNQCPPKKCPVKGQAFMQCGSACPPTCSNPNPICTRQCVPGCQCPRGTVLNEVTNKCVSRRRCPLPGGDQCPPKCSASLCKKNNRAICSIPGPREIPGCTGPCQVTFCSACYFSEVSRPLPGVCRICGSGAVSTVGCLKRWAKCIHKADIKENGKPPQSIQTEDNFRCYRYPCPLRG